MKKEEKILFALDAVDDGLIDDAAPCLKKASSRPRYYKIAAVAACLVLAVATVLTATLLGGDNDPPTTIPTYTPDSEFVASIRDYIINSEDTDLVGANNDVPEDSTGGSSNGNYMEITDNQVAGIVEGDLAKATDKYLFRLGSHTIYIYSINGKDSELVSYYTLPVIEGERSAQQYFDMFLSEDGCTLTLFCNNSGGTLGATAILSVDVTDVHNPVEKSRVIIDGRQNIVRRIGDKFYLITDWMFSKNRIDLDVPESYIPSIQYPDARHICDADKIIAPEKISGVYYRYLTVLSESDLSLYDEMAMMVSGTPRFVNGSIVFDAQYSAPETVGDKTVNRAYSKIGVLSITDRLEWRGSFTIKGWSSGHFSFDERDGYLRIVVSTTDRVSYTTYNDSASLYVYDINTLERVAAVEEFAPYGEGVTAVRFEGDKLYVCTAEIMTYQDPVYFFDLSDYSNISHVNTGFIDGFSTSLIDMGEGYLIGMGLENNLTCKIEVYKRDGDAVVSVDKYLFEGSYNSDYKSFLINREENYFGVNATVYSENYRSTEVYLVFRLEGERLTLVSTLEKSVSFPRSFVHDGSVYITLPNELYVMSEAGDIKCEIITTHTWGEKVLIQEPTCGHRGINRQTCSCGRVSESIDYSVEFVSHELSGGICTNCGEDVGSPSKNKGLLIYTSLHDGTCYVSGVRDSILGVLEIPDRAPNGDIVIGIGEGAIMYSGITELTLPDSLAVIGNYAFYYNYISYIDTKNVRTIGKGAFMMSEQLTGVRLGNRLESIGESAFGYCYALEEVVVPDSVSEIGSAAFTGCKAMRSIRLPSGLKKLSLGIFNQCNSLVQITLPEGLVTIEDYAFNGCSKLLTVNIPDSVESVGSRAFSYCDRLAQVQLGASVSSIGDSAFAECINLVEVVNRSNLDIQVGAKDHGMIAYYAISVIRGGSSLEFYGDYLFFTAEERNVLIGYFGNDTELYLPTLEGGRGYEVGAMLFKNNMDITAVHIPEGVTAIGDEAFSGCTGIDSITLPDSVIKIGRRAFSNCYFTRFDMGDGVVTVGEEAFQYCSKLVILTLSEKLEVIGNGAFSSCRKMNTSIPSSVREIGERAFLGCFKLSTARIPDGVTVIANSAFDNCNSLTTVIIPDSVVEIKSAFYGCTSLTRICYKGSEEQWNAILKDRNNGLFDKANITFNYAK